MQKSIVKKQNKDKVVKATTNSRTKKAEKMVYDGKVTRIVQDVETYLVQSQTKEDIYYMVQLIDNKRFRCNCPDFERNHESHKCKHIILVQLSEEYSPIKKKIHTEWRNDQYDF